MGARVPGRTLAEGKACVRQEQRKLARGFSRRERSEAGRSSKPRKSGCSSHPRQPRGLAHSHDRWRRRQASELQTGSLGERRRQLERRWRAREKLSSSANFKNPERDDADCPASRANVQDQLQGNLALAVLFSLHGE